MRDGLAGYAGGCERGTQLWDNHVDLIHARKLGSAGINDVRLDAANVDRSVVEIVLVQRVR